MMEVESILSNEQKNDSSAESIKYYWTTLREMQMDKESTTLSSTFSADGNYVVCGTNFGFINIWNVDNLWSKNTFGRASPALSFNANMGNIYALMFLSPTILVGAGERCIKAWNWNYLLSLMDNFLEKGYPLMIEELPTLFVLPNPQTEEGKGINYFETNGIVKDAVKPDVLYAACGDCNGYAWNVETKQQIGVFKGHTGYLHCITQRRNQQIVTGSEDGYVKLWDPRTLSSVHTLNPASTPTDSMSPKWVSCIAVDRSDNWMVAGGGNRFLTMWHLPSLTVSCFMPTAGAPQAVHFSQDDRIFSGGNEDQLYHWKKDGTFITKTSSNSKSIFTISESTRNRLLCVAGTSPVVDLSLPNYGIISASLDIKNSVK